MYAERVGAINFVSREKESATKVLSQLKKIARAVWSNPPVHGAAIAAEIVSSPEMFKEWNEEMEMMAGRIKVPFHPGICHQSDFSSDSPNPPDSVM